MMVLDKLRQIAKQLNGFIVLLTLVVFFILIKLGLWQSQRAVEKELRLERISELSQGQALSLQEVLLLQDDQEVINDLPVKLHGEFVSEYVFLLDNQPHHGQIGYRVYQTYVNDKYWLLINLGWVKGDIDRNKLPNINPLIGQYQIRGHIREIELGIQLQAQHFQQVNWPLRVQQIELDKFSKIIDNKLLPFVVYLDKNEQIGYEKNWQPIVMPPEKHRAYAFQWFSLAIAWLVLMVWASVKITKTTAKKI